MTALSRDTTVAVRGAGLSPAPTEALDSRIPLLELRNVEKSFAGRLQPVLVQLNLSIPEGQFAAVVGCSGAGKTTLISLIAGLSKPDRGEILFAGRPLGPPGPERAVVFQNYSLLPWLTVLENVTLAVQAASPQLNRRSAREHAQYFIDLVKLTAAIDKRPRELSGGMRQRVALARALAMEPRLLLLDEPLSALDALTRATLQDELARIWAETTTTVIMVTNDIDEAILLADCVYPLTRGPRATLGRPIPVVLSRPRARTRLSLVLEYQRVRREIIAFLEGLRDQEAESSEKEKDRQPMCNTAPRSLAPTPRPV
jgi:nitrate/nitrite transport system ATP-binding protein